ncbi:hypothetical protein B0T25DRAFT_542739 [Lasiosphaeria hispida]|uniref:Uncharacterized protein n=1 Tax=Lasiosphaeria hispida TaxID=260671 RepID=A0AAJ0HHG9_9PEZI|nr:hypothetical protein B0T25DRAFT_542739 [Lasiosphaeria hispida]
MTIQIVQGFSKTNRWLLYASFMLSPAQFASGLKNNCPSNIGFLAYNWYNQFAWYHAIQNKDMHAISLIIPHLNTIFAFTYLGGVSSGNIVIGVLLGLGTAGVIVFNTVCAWTAWAVHMPEGYGQYQFFFFGWRTLDEGWRKFFCLWQVGDSLFALIAVVAAVGIAIYVALKDEDIPWWLRYAGVPVGAAAMLLFGWPLIMWTELIMLRNDLESETDMIAVWLFVAQVGTMLVPSCGSSLACIAGGLRGRKSSSDVELGSVKS